MVTTTEITAEKERRYGIGYRPIAKVSVEKKYADDTVFVPEKEQPVVERRISVPKQKQEREVEVKQEQKAEVETITGLSVKSKVMLGLYVGIAFVLSIIAAIAGIVIGNSAKTVSALESQVKASSAVVRVQQAQIDELSSDSVIEQKATENGMVNASKSEQIELLVINDNEEKSSSTNFFDIFCDWFSEIIGG
jgi:cell division protein FtsL